jgi:hypothetical protein
MLTPDHIARSDNLRLAHDLEATAAALKLADAFANGTAIEFATNGVSPCSTIQTTPTKRLD